MATPNYSNTFEIEDTTTGKFYRVEGVEGTTREEAIQWIETLDENQLAEREIVKAPTAPEGVTAPQNPAAVPQAPAPSAASPVPMGEQEVQTVIQQGFGPKGEDIRFLGEGSGDFLADLALRDVPYADVNKTLQTKAREAGIVPAAEMFVGGEEAWKQYVQGVKESGGVSSAATYTSGIDNMFNLPSAEGVEAPEDPTWAEAFQRSYENAVQYGTSGILARTYYDWMDTGKDKLRTQFPDASEDELEQIHETLIARVQRGMRERGEKLAENDPIIPWLAGELITAGVEDFTPLGAATTAGRIGAGAGVGAASSTGYQSADINAGVRDEFSGAEVAMDAAFGAGLQGVMEGVSGIARTVTNRDVEAAARPDGVTAVRTPTNRKGSRKYKEQIAETSADIADNINKVTADWQNAPQIEVHDSFGPLRNIDTDAVGVYLGDGRVAINSEAVVKEANRLGVGPEDVTSSVLFHESLGHYGLEQRFADELDTVLDSWVQNSPEFSREVSAWMDKNPDAYNGNTLRAAEEVLAEWSEGGKLKGSFYDTIANKIKEIGRAMGLDLNYSNREIKAILATAHKSVTDGKNIAKGEPLNAGPRYMFIGQKAENLSDFDKRRLNQAKRLEGRGTDVTRDSNTRATLGWFKGDDGKWRKEIDDRGANVLKVNADTLDNLAEHVENTKDIPGSEVYNSFEYRDALDVLADPRFQEMSDDGAFYLSDVLDHPELMDAYPMLNDLKVTRSNILYDKGDEGGFFSPSEGMIYISPKMSNKDAKSVLLHEAQHAVQFLEGFAFGGTPESALKSIPDPVLFKGAKQYTKFMKSEIKRLNAKADAFDHYLTHPTIEEARDVYSISGDDRATDDLYLDMADELGLDIYNPAHSDQLDQLDELWDRLVLRTPAGAKLEAGKPRRDARKKQFELAQLNKAIEDKVPATVRRIVGKDKQAQFEAYEHLYGEAEARDVQARMNMTPEERAATAPLSSEPQLDPESLISTDVFGQAASSERPFMDVGIRSANDVDSTIKLDKNGRPILPPRVMGGRERLAYNRAMVQYHQRRADKAYKNGNLKQLEREKGRIDRYREAMEEEIKYLNEGGRRESTSTRPAVREYQPDTKATNVSEPANNRYMRPGRVDNVKVDPNELTPDELFESENALDVLNAAVKGYEPTVLSMDDIKAEAEARGFTASDLMKRKSNLGQISERLMMYDIAAEKMNDKITKLSAKINSGNFTVGDKHEYLKTLARFQDLTARIFDEQGEAGRALRAIQELNFTKRRVSGIQSALSGLQNAMEDDEVFARFVKEVQEGLEETQSKKPGKLGQVFANALNTPRALMSSLDLSAPLRQGIFLIGRPEFWKALPSMFKYAMSEESYRGLMRDITSRDTYPLMTEAGVAFSTIDGKLSSREEDFMSQWAEKVPGVRASNRAYTGFLNKLRADAFDSMAADLEGAGVDLSKDKKALDKKALKDLGWFISNATGRGSLGNWNSAAPQLTAAFFSPRLMASRVNMLRPDNYVKLHPAVRKQAITSLLSFGGFAASLMTLAGMAGMDVETDPRSSDFGKLRMGNTRYDVLGGFGQYITLAARLASFIGSQAYEGITGEEGIDHYKTTSTGKTKKYNEGEGKFDQTAGGAIARFFRNKASPVASYVMDYFFGENVVGEKFDPVDSTAQRFMPMFAADVADMMGKYGMVEGAARSAPGVFGVGVQDFTPSNLDPEMEQEAPVSFSDKGLEDGENEYVTVKDGEVRLKGEAREEWQRLLNIYTSEWMKDETSRPEWETLSDAEKEEIIKAVRKDARDQTKQDMIALMGLE